MSCTDVDANAPDSDINRVTVDGNGGAEPTISVVDWVDDPTDNGVHFLGVGG